MRGPMRGPSYPEVTDNAFDFWVQTHLNVLCLRAGVGEQALKVKGDFTWEESAAPSLTNLEVSVDSGDLMVVVGSTGSGKSSLLGAALGLMQQVEGEPVDLRGKASAPSVTCLL